MIIPTDTDNKYLLIAFLFLLNYNYFIYLLKLQCYEISSLLFYISLNNKLLNFLSIKNSGHEPITTFHLNEKRPWNQQ